VRVCNPRANVWQELTIVEVEADSNPPEPDASELDNETEMNGSNSTENGDSGVKSAEGAVGSRKRKEGGKSLGWGDKKPPPLNYRPWYSIFSW
jgi:hypothetical protein